jgi:hypothetical protein
VDGEGVDDGAGLVADVTAVVKCLEVGGPAEAVQVGGLVGGQSNWWNADALRNGENAAPPSASSDLRVVDDGPVLQGKHRHDYREEEEESELHGSDFGRRCALLFGSKERGGMEGKENFEVSVFFQTSFTCEIKV